MTNNNIITFIYTILYISTHICNLKEIKVKGNYENIIIDIYIQLGEMGVGGCAIDKAHITYIYLGLGKTNYILQALECIVHNMYSWKNN